MVRRSHTRDNDTTLERRSDASRSATDQLHGDEGEPVQLNEEGDGDIRVDGNFYPAHKEASHISNARQGLNVRSGPGIDFPIIRSLPLGAPVNLLKREGRWGLIDERGDGAADGFVHLAFLNERASADFSSFALGATAEVRGFWAQRNPRLAKLYDRAGSALVDPRLLQASALGTSEFESQNENYRIEMYGPGGGFRSSGSTANHGAQPGTGLGAAMDFVVIDRRTMHMLTNHPGREHQHQGTVGENAPIYQNYFNEVVRAGSRLFQHFDGMARFGGYFANGENAMDTMHIDLRGLVAPMGGGDLLHGFTNEQMRRWNIPNNHPYR